MLGPDGSEGYGAEEEWVEMFGYGLSHFREEAWKVKRLKEMPLG